MNNKKLLALLGSILIVLVLVALPFMGACAKPAPAPAPTPTPAPAPTPAPPAEEPFPTKTITWLVGAKPGGGYDLHSRSITKYMMEYLPVDIIVKNVPGAGQRNAMNLLVRAKPDGYTMHLVNTAGLALYQIMNPDVDWDLKKLTWLGCAATDDYGIYVRKDSPFNSVEDMQRATKPLRIGTVDISSTSGTTAVISSHILNIPLNLVTGFGGRPEIEAAILAGDLDAYCYPIASSFPLVKSEDVKCIVMLTEKRHYLVPNTPSATELGYPELAALGNKRLIATTPGVPEYRAKILADAIAKAMADPGIIEWSKKVDMPLTPLTPEEAAQVQAQYFDIMPKYMDIIAQYTK